MSDLYQEIAGLPPEKRKLLELLMRKEGEADFNLPVLPRSDLHHRPLSFVQERLWFIDQLVPNSPAYNVPRIIHIQGALDVGALQAAFSEIVRRHEILRTTCKEVNGKPVQSLHPAEPLEIPLVDLRELPEYARRAEAERLADEEVQQPVDLTRSPLLRTKLLWLHQKEYFLVLTTHHYVADAPAMEAMMKELATLYQAFTKGEPSPLPELPIQYPDYAQWQRARFAQGLYEDQLDFWLEELSGALEPLELPTDRPRPAAFSYRGAKVWFNLPSDLAEGIKRLSREHGVTIFMTLLAAFQTLLHRYSGQERIAVGTIVSDRECAGAAGLIGSFTNNIVLVTDFSGDPTFRELLGRIREKAPSAYANQDFPFENLVDTLGVERDMSRPPLFQVMFSNHEGTVFREFNFHDMIWSVLPFDQKGGRFDLSLEVQGWDTGLPRGYFEYSSDLFDKSSVDRITGHYLTFLQSILAHPDGCISRLDYLTGEEKRRLLVDWNDTQRTIPGDSTLLDLFEAQVAKNPDASAVVFGDHLLTYGQLNQRANQTARYLNSFGVGPGVVVGVFMERSLEMVIGLLGILKAGGAYLPLDPEYPEDRLDYMLSDSGASVMLTKERFADRVPTGDAQVVPLDSGWEALSKFTPSNLLREATPQDLAYMIYTSGSTGYPKGVEIQHLSLVNFLLSVQQEPGFSEQDTLLAVTTLSFDIAGLEIFLPLIAGGRLEIASREVASDGLLLARAIEESGATVMQATPSTWRMLLDARWEGSKRLKILCGGEALPADLAQELLGISAQLWNMYGPTETTIWSLIHHVKPGEDPVPIGRPIANTQVYILDAYGQPVPVGAPGELHIGGLGMAQGYHNLPALTAEGFVPDPFSSQPSSRLYRTGDRARYQVDGVFECLGREDLQVKVRGFRIELGEIETWLNRHPFIKQSAAAVRQVRAGEQSLVAYLVFEDGKAPTSSELRRYLKDKIPDYMIPTWFETLEGLPLTPNGKLDRAALPEPSSARPQLEADFVPPSTPVEQRLVGIWQELLGIERLGIRDNFFELGGHSLLAVQLVSRLRDTFQVELPLRSIFKNPTVEGQALLVEELLLLEVEALSEEQAQDLL